jgi:hypothetical protein
MIPHPAQSRYWTFSFWAGAAGAGLTFLGCWLYCIATYGFLVGVSIGWLPSAMVAAVVGFALYFLWPFAALGIVVALVIALRGGNQTAEPTEDAAAMSDAAAAGEAAASAPRDYTDRAVPLSD